MGLSLPSRSGVLSKAVWAIALVALADWLFFRHPVGWTVGLFAAALAAAAAIVGAASTRKAASLGALLVAALFALNLVDAPNALAWALYWAALAIAVLAPLAAPDDGAWRWLARIAVFSVAGPVTFFRDASGLYRRSPSGWSSIARRLVVLVLPIVGGAVFLIMFAAANPLIDQFLTQIQWPQLDLARFFFWAACLRVVWAVLRPFSLTFAARPPAVGEAKPILNVTPASIGLSLVVFNVLFAVQNGLDIAFLWSGAALPRGVTLAQYAHRGAYTLIVTALLAGALVLVTLNPSSSAARRPWLRALVILWVAQNVLLVASSALRLWDYVEAYSLTRLRLAAFIWMALVAVGLILICWRMLRGRSANWLVLANLAAVGFALALCSVVDLGSVAAEWNVNHAREAGGEGVDLDVCYLERLGDSALVPLSELSTRRHAAAFDDRIAGAADRLVTDLAARQQDWRSWTWRGDRRLRRARILLANQVGKPAPPLQR